MRVLLVALFLIPSISWASELENGWRIEFHQDPFHRKTFAVAWILGDHRPASKTKMTLWCSFGEVAASFEYNMKFSGSIAEPRTVTFRLGDEFSDEVLELKKNTLGTSAFSMSGDRLKELLNRSETTENIVLKDGDSIADFSTIGLAEARAYLSESCSAV